MFFARLDCALLEPEETRYAEIPREMLAAGEWVVPLYHGQPYFDKPPLLYWLVMLSYSLFGVHDWAARLVPGGCGVLTVLITYLWGRAIFRDAAGGGGRGAFLGALTLALMPRFIYLGRFVATDAVLNVGVVAALACLHVAVSRARVAWPWWLAGGLACGFGLLAKGPVALVLVGFPIGVFLGVNTRAVRPGWRELTCFLAALLLIALPWYALILREAGFAGHFFWKHHVQRFVEPFDHAKPFWFYGPDLIVGCLPWSLLAIPLALRLHRDRFDVLQRHAPEIALPVLAAGWCFLFFSASGCKRVGYVLPVFAPLALAFGWQLDDLLNRRLLAPARLAVIHAVVFVACLGAVLWALPWYNDRFSLRHEVLTAKAIVPPSAGIVCYPRGWDSVNYYLGRDDCRVFVAAQRSELMTYLHGQADSVLFLRDDDDCKRLLAELQPALTVETISRQGAHQVVRVSWGDRRPILASRSESP